MRGIYFWYFPTSPTEKCREKIIDYISEISSQLGSIENKSRVLVNPVSSRIDALHLVDLGDSSTGLECACRYVLSQDREIIPCSVDCDRIEDFNMIGRILEESHRGVLTRGPLGIPGLFGQRRIKPKV